MTVMVYRRPLALILSISYPDRKNGEENNNEIALTAISSNLLAATLDRKPQRTRKIRQTDSPT